MKKLLMSLMVVGVLVSTPSLCGEEKGPWTLGKVTVDHLNRHLTGGLDSEELRKNHIAWVRIVKDVFGNNEVWTDSFPDVSFHGKFPNEEKKEDGSGAARYCPGQCKFLGLDWSGGYGQKELKDLFGHSGWTAEHYSHCSCTDKKARLEKGEYIDYSEGFWSATTDSYGALGVAPRQSSFNGKDCNKFCSAVGKNKFVYAGIATDDVCGCKETKAAQEKIQEKIQQETQETVDKLMEPVKELQKK